MINRKHVLLSVLLCGLLMTGCGAQFPVLTAEQEAMIAGYAATVVLKHNRNYDNRLVDLADLPKVEPDETVAAPPEEEVPEGMDPVADTEVVDKSEEESLYSSIQDFYGLSGLNITYLNYTVTDSYPEAQEGDIAFALDATSGNKLLVLSFELLNTSGEAMEVDLFSPSTKYRVSVNGEPSISFLHTMLSDELSSYIGSLAPDEAVNTVLVAMIPEASTGGIESIKLIMKNESESASFVLQ